MTNNNTDVDLDQQLQHYKQLFTQHNQGHIFTHIDQLNTEQKQRLLNECKSIDVEAINNAYTHALHTEQQQLQQLQTHNNIIEPYHDITYSNNLTSQQKPQYYNSGLELLSTNSVGVVLMSGGSGTRLKSTLPKGMYDIGLLSHKSLFQLQAERLLRLQHIVQQYRTANKLNNDKPIQINWYIMTSISTHSIICHYFAQHQYFGLKQQQCMFFQQDEIPAYDINTGTILMNSTHSLALSPNGNGGIYSAMYKHGILQHMTQHNIKYVHIYGIDNVLVKIADPTFVGWFAATNAPIGNKVVLKALPNEKVGVMCIHNNVTKILEYSEIPVELSQQRDPTTNQLLYGAANIAQHIFTLDILNELATTQLPYHIARKAIQCIDKNGNTLTPTHPNAIKLEMFIFDIFQYSQRVVAYAVDRQSEFSPVKNASGAGVVDSPATAVRDITLYNTQLIEQAGGTVINKNNDILEISPLVTYNGEGLADMVKGKTYTAPVHIE